MRFTRLPAVLAVSCAVLIAGCTSAGTATPTPSPGGSTPSVTTPAVASNPKPTVTTPTSKAAGSATSATSAGSIPKPASIANDVTKRKDVELSSCAPGGGGWVAKGKVTNSGDATKDYVITVFFTTQQATVLGSATTKVSAKARTSASWQAVGHFKGTNAMTCVLRGVG